MLRLTGCLFCLFFITCATLLAQPTATSDEQTGAFLQRGHTQDVHFVGWSPDGTLLVSQSGVDGWIRVWNAATGQLNWEIKAALLKPDAPLKSPDGKLLASGERNKGYEIRDAQSGNLISSIPVRSATAQRVISPDSSIIAKRDSYLDHAVRLFDAKTNQLIRLLEGHPGIILATTFSPDGKVIATGSTDRTIRFWDPQTGALLKTLFGHTQQVTGLAFSGDGKTLVSTSRDDTVKIWNVADGRLLSSFKLHTAGADGIISPNVTRDGRTLIGAYREAVKIWDLTTGKELYSLTSNELHPSGGPGELQSTEESGDVLAVALGPDETLIVSAHEDKTIKIWDAQTATLKRIIKTRFPDLKAVVFSPDGKLIATGNYESDCRVDFWSVQTGKRVLSLGPDSDYVNSLSFSRDGSKIASGHAFKDLIIWNAKTGKLIRKLDQPFSEFDNVAFSPDSKFLVSAGRNQNVLLWNVQNGKLVWAALPVDWETDRRLAEEGKKRKTVSVAEEAERRETLALEKETATWMGRVLISFDHFGEPLNPLEQRMMEKGELNKSLTKQSAAEAEGVWLRLRNNSPLPISFRTDSFYAPRPECGLKRKDSSLTVGLCDGAEVSIQYEIEEAKGMPVAYGIDVSFQSILPPGASVLFSVLRTHLTNGRSVFVRYRYLRQKEETKLEEIGSAYRAKFRSSQLRNRR